MKTIAASAILSVMFLSAGAFAGSSHTVTKLAMPKAENVTVILKNQTWPPAGQISVDPCAVNRCIGI